MSTPSGYSSVATDPEQALGFDSMQLNNSVACAESNKVETRGGRTMRKWRQFPGRNQFCCDGRLMTGRGLGLFYLTCVLIVVTTLLFLAFDCRLLMPRFTAAIPVVACLLFIFVMGTLLRTALSDPGIIPRATAQEAADTERHIEAAGPDGTSIQGPPRVKDVVVHGVDVKLKFCYTCKIFRPPRASHCGFCDNCIERFDHHCPWVGNCVGRRNYRYFYLFLVSLAVDCIFILAFSITNIALLSLEHGVLTALKESPASVVEAIVAFLSVWSVIGLAGFHSYLVCCNITTNEDIKHSRAKSNAKNIYDNGSLCDNFLEVVCGPVPPSLIDRRGIVVTEDAERVTVATAVPAATATEAIANEAFANSTVAVVDRSDNERFASSDKKPRDALKSTTSDQPTALLRDVEHL